MKSIRRLIWAAVVVVASSLSPVAQAADMLASASETYQQQCPRAYQSNPKFGPLHGKLATLGFGVTEKVEAPDRVPTDDEVIALKALMPVASRCASLLLQMQGQDGPIRWDAPPADLNQSAKIWILESSLGGLGGLLLLSEKRLTYADLYDITKGRDTRMKVVTSNAAGTVPADGRIKLTCTSKLRNPIGGEVYEVGEVQYFIDPAANSIWASRWEPPIDIRITDTLISFHQGQKTVSISRATGAFEQVIPANQTSVMANGTCQPIGAPKF